uniref:Putative secreted protein n=1 Tax=Anopheles marajoara TaxID=58244 RepID=A0A2M4C671_9DIPT
MQLSLHLVLLLLFEIDSRVTFLDVVQRLAQLVAFIRPAHVRRQRVEHLVEINSTVFAFENRFLKLLEMLQRDTLLGVQKGRRVSYPTVGRSRSATNLNIEIIRLSCLSLALQILIEVTAPPNGGTAISIAGANRGLRKQFTIRRVGWSDKRNVKV